MNRRFLPTVAYTAEVTVTAGWLASVFLPCPCPRHGGRR